MSHALNGVLNAIITTPTTVLHVLCCPGILIGRMLDIVDFGPGFFPRCLVPLCPVDMTLCKLHLSRELALLINHI